MTGKETRVVIKGRPLTISVDGLGPLEISTIAGQVEKKINEIEEATKVPDNSKLALMAAFWFATELYNLRQKSENSNEADSRKIEELAGKLESVLDKELF
jgi:cell division protein ZapA (FtsZ GTPase activity inhibitor)